MGRDEIGRPHYRLIKPIRLIKEFYTLSYPIPDRIGADINKEIQNTADKHYMDKFFKISFKCKGYA